MPRRGLPETVRMRHDEHYVEALTASAGAPVGRMVAIDQIDPNPTQPRQMMGDLSELIARVNALIRRADLRHTGATLKVGVITLDPLTRNVTQNERRVDLSPREFALLEYLMRNAGRTVSRSRIAEAVWNYKFDPETNVVDVYINYLRKKLTFAGARPPIRTVRGAGYRLEAS